ncbi:hypothetical protein PMAYCL1PPCAC_29538, partial [Pristionchus mayeri]
SQAKEDEKEDVSAKDSSIPFLAEESLKKVFLQSLFPFLLGGISSIGTGQVLHYAQSSTSYVEIPEFMEITPALSGLKGNIECILASKLSTLAHQGVLDEAKNRNSIIIAGIGLQQFQVVIMTLLATIGSLITSLINQSNCLLNGKPVLFLFSVSFLSITTSSFLISTLLIGLIIGARKYNINPDNVTTPIASSLSDLVAIAAMLLFAFLLHDSILGERWYVGIILLSLLLLLMPFWLWLLHRREEMIKVAKSGWVTLVLSCILSSVAGAILTKAISKYPDISIFAPILMGISGNRTAMQSSRISTQLHTSSNRPGYLPDERRLVTYLSPYRAFCSNDDDARGARLLLLTAPPFQILFITIAFIIAYFFDPTGKKIPLHPAFFFAYILTAMFHMFILLYLSQMCVHAMWSYKLDPDFHAIPFLAGMGDLLGTALIYGFFSVLTAVQSRDGEIIQVIKNATENIDPTRSAICMST